jgi:hypothetical protein
MSSASGGIFISYRREESTVAAAHLYDRLSDVLGESRVFMDVDSIGLGLDFVEVVQEAVSSCEVLLVIIGPTWLQVTDESGARRIDSPNDFVRLEVETALQRNVRVVPVLVSGGALPSSEQLPPSLEPLVRRQALELRDATFRSDAHRLVERVERILPKAEEPVVGAGPATPVAEGVPRKPVESSTRSVELVDKSETLRTLRVTLDSDVHLLTIKTGLWDDVIEFDGQQVAKAGIFSGDCELVLKDGDKLLAAVLHVTSKARLRNLLLTVGLTVEGQLLYQEEP